MTSRKYPAGEETDLQLVALLWVLTRQRLQPQSAALTRMTLEHFELIAGNPDAPGVVRGACKRLAQQLRQAARSERPPAHPLAAPGTDATRNTETA